MKFSSPKKKVAKKKAPVKKKKAPVKKKKTSVDEYVEIEDLLDSDDPNAEEVLRLEKKVSSLSNKLAIDRTGLDEDLAEQPTLYYAASDLSAEILNLRDRIREDQKALRGELITESFRDADKKPTVSQQDAYVETHPRWRRSRKSYKEAEAAYAKVEGLKDAFRQRMNALSALSRIQADSAYQHSSTRS